VPPTVKISTAQVQEAILRAQRKHPTLVVIQGAESDLGTHVVVGEPVLIGRDPDIGLSLHDERASRRHCRVLDRDGKFFVEDLSSTNGTRLNGRSFKGARELATGDQIFIGDCVIKFTYCDDFEIRYHARMDALVSTDHLTGLQAKRRFDADFARAIAKVRLSEGDLSVMMLDLDGLKQINDTHGHPVGAHTIAEVGKAIGNIINRKGSSCRYGGDEFAAFMPGLSKKDAISLADSVCERVRNLEVEKDGIKISTTISVGVASFPDDGESPEQLLRKADAALYRAKRAGRNSVHS
jgi:diguanylate cyclase (GGDEF)-like protein